VLIYQQWRWNEAGGFVRLTNASANRPQNVGPNPHVFDDANLISGRLGMMSLLVDDGFWIIGGVDANLAALSDVWVFNLYYCFFLVQFICCFQTHPWINTCRTLGLYRVLDGTLNSSLGQYNASAGLVLPTGRYYAVSCSPQPGELLFYGGTTVAVEGKSFIYIVLVTHDLLLFALALAYYGDLFRFKVNSSSVPPSANYELIYGYDARANATYDLTPGSVAPGATMGGSPRSSLPARLFSFSAFQLRPFALLLSSIWLIHGKEYMCHAMIW